MAGQTLTAADAILLEDVQSGVREQLNNKVALLAQAQKNTKDTDGRYARLAVHVTRNSGVGARAEGGTLPAAGNQGWAEEHVTMKFQYGRIQLTGQVIEHSNSNRGAFVSALKAETDGMVNDVKRDYNRQHWGTSDGVIATCGTTTNVQVVQLAATTSQVQMRQLEPGMLIDIADTTAAPVAITNGTSRTILSVDTTNLTVTIDVAGGNVTTSSSHRIYRAGSGGSGASQKEVTGLQTIVKATGTLHNVNPSTYPVWASTVDTTGGAISEDLILKNIQAVGIACGDEPDQIWTSVGLYRATAALLQSIKRFTNTTDLKGGWKGLEFAAGGSSVSISSERDAPKGLMFLLNTKHLISFYSADWKWDNRMGTVLKNVTGQDAFEAWMFRYGEFATDQRNSHGLLSGLTDTTS